MSQKPPTQLRNFDRSQLSPNTPETIVAMIETQVSRAIEAGERVDREGSVVRDTKGAVIPHPAIVIEANAMKLASALIERHRSKVKKSAAAN